VAQQRNCVLLELSNTVTIRFPIQPIRCEVREDKSHAYLQQTPVLGKDDIFSKTKLLELHMHQKLKIFALIMEPEEGAWGGCMDDLIAQGLIPEELGKAIKDWVQRRNDSFHKGNLLPANFFTESESFHPLLKFHLTGIPPQPKCKVPTTDGE
jgi:hypothetical protein